MRIVFRTLAEVGSDWIVMDVVEVLEVIVPVAHAAVGEAALPDGKLRFKLVGETTFDELGGSLKGDLLRSEEQVDVVGHHYIGVELVVAFSAIVLEVLEEEFRIRCLLEEPSAIVGLGGDKEGAVACCSGGDSHRWPSLPQRLKPGR